MKPAAFDYHRPGTLAEGLALLARHGDDARLLAGGQSLVPMMNLRLVAAGHLIDLNDLHELDYIREDGDTLEIGALVRHQALAGSDLVTRRAPMLAEAAAGIGHDAIRHRGTIGGSLVHADPAAQLALVAVTLGAEVVLQGPGGERRVPAAEFVEAAMMVAIEPDEILTAVRIPAIRPGWRHAFKLFCRRQGDFALASVAVAARLDGGRVEALHLGVGAVGERPERLGPVEGQARGQRLDDDVILSLARQAAAEAEVEDTARAPAAFRRDLVADLAGRALRRIAGQEGNP